MPSSAGYPSLDILLKRYIQEILAAALESHCDTLYTEEMQNGQSIGPLTIRNPFLNI
jgi:predicted nucleic acid-binding protein